MRQGYRTPRHKPVTALAWLPGDGIWRPCGRSVRAARASRR